MYRFFVGDAAKVGKSLKFYEPTDRNNRADACLSKHINFRNTCDKNQRSLHYDTFLSKISKIFHIYTYFNNQNIIFTEIYLKTERKSCHL